MPSQRIRCKVTHNSRGEPLKPHWAMKGQLVCGVHGGRAPRSLAAAQKRLQEAEAEKALERYKATSLGDGRMPGSNVDMLLWMVESTAHNVVFYEDQVRLLTPDKIISTGMFGDYLNLWVKLLNEEKDRLVKYSSDCLKIGLEAKRVEIVQEQAEIFIRAQIAGWDALNLDASQRDVANKAVVGALRDFKLVQGG